MDRPTCRTCPYWYLLYGTDQKDFDRGCAVAGECRRLPPSDKVRTVYGNYWCGEHPQFARYIQSERLHLPETKAVPDGQ